MTSNKRALDEVEGEKEEELAEKKIRINEEADEHEEKNESGEDAANGAAGAGEGGGAEEVTPKKESSEAAAEENVSAATAAEAGATPSGPESAHESGDAAAAATDNDSNAANTDSETLSKLKEEAISAAAAAQEQANLLAQQRQAQLQSAAAAGQAISGGPGQQFQRPQDDAPSKVVHFRNVDPIYVTEPALHAVCAQFGPVERMLMLTGKKQALVQFDSIQSASNLINRNAGEYVLVNNRQCYFRYSRHQELTGQSTAMPNPNDPAALAAYAASAAAAAAAGVSGTSSMRPAMGMGMQNRVVLAIFNSQYNPDTFVINVDTVYSVFAPYGAIQKLVVMKKPEKYQALIQYATPSSAQAAMQYLNGQPMQLGPVSLSIVLTYSRHEQLNVPRNTDMSRDFTSPAYAAWYSQQHGSNPQ